MKITDRERAQHIAYYHAHEWIRAATGLYRWQMGNPVPIEIIETWAQEGLISAPALALAKLAHRDELNAFLDDYRRARANGPSAEERASARAAHGPGVKLVDIVTGYEWTT